MPKRRIRIYQETPQEMLMALNKRETQLMEEISERQSELSELPNRKRVLENEVIGNMLRSRDVNIDKVIERFDEIIDEIIELIKYPKGNGGNGNNDDNGDHDNNDNNGDNGSNDTDADKETKQTAETQTIETKETGNNTTGETQETYETYEETHQEMQRAS